MAEQQALRHIPVMLGEAVEGLAVQAGGRYLDGTFGRGGHARAVLSRLGPEGRLLLMDRDPQAIATAQAEFASDARVSIRHANFSSLADWEETGAGLDGILLDLGVSSPQLDEAARGFSFMADAPLDMRMDTTQGESAADFIAHADEREIADVLWTYGEERFSRKKHDAGFPTQAAAYCALSPQSFSRWVKQGTLPRPLPFTTRWDQRAIDRALDQVSLSGQDNSGRSAFDDWKGNQNARSTEGDS